MDRAKVMLAKIAGVLKKAYNFVNKFCGAHPILCKIVKILLIMMVIAAVMALFASAAHASVDVSGMEGAEPGTYQMSDDGLNAVKGLAALGTEDQDPEVQQAAVDALRWLEKVHKGSEVVDLATASEEGSVIVRKAYKVVQNADPETFEALADLGEKTVVQANTYRETVTAGGKTSMKVIRWASLEAPK